MKLLNCDRAAVIALAIHCGLVAFTCWAYSPVLQEPAQLVAGVTGWRLGRFDLFHVNPPLVRLVAALPVVSLSPNYETSKYDEPPIGREEYSKGRTFIDDNRERSRFYFVVARWACIPFTLIGGLVCWRWAGELYGPAAGLISVILWCFCPYMLGHASTIMTDVPSAAMGSLAMYQFWKWLNAPNWQNSLITGVCLGLAEVTKFTLLILYPLMLILALIFAFLDRKTDRGRDVLRQAAMMGLIFLTSLYLINCVYRFEGSFTKLGAYQFQSSALTGNTSAASDLQATSNRFSGTSIGELPIPLPANYVQGIDTQKLDFEHGLPSYLGGKWADHGWWYYYIYALAIKLPIGTLVLIGLAMGRTLLMLPVGSTRRNETVLLTSFLAILGLVSWQSGFSVHSRYVIPALPFLFIWTSKVAQRDPPQESKSGPGVLTILTITALAWSMLSALSIYPYSISYFNELTNLLPVAAGTPKAPQVPTDFERANALSRIQMALTSGSRSGPQHLLDSNIDWSQDLFFLEKWILSHSEARPFKLAYFGSFPLELTRIASDGYPPEQTTPTHQGTNHHDAPSPLNFALVPGWYAISVNELFARSSRYRYFLEREPHTIVGYSFYIYFVPPTSPQ